MNIDIDILIIIVVAVLILLLLNYFSSECSNLESNNVSESEQEIRSEDIEDIKITDEILNEMIDIVTTYSMMRQKQNEKMILIYLSTFHLFDMNYDYRSIAKLDKILEKYPYIGNEYQYPTGNMYHNLQKAIITNITLSLTRSEVVLTSERLSDRKIIELYIKKLFRSIGIY
jgi:hypothetical protein